MFAHTRKYEIDPKYDWNFSLVPPPLTHSQPTYLGDPLSRIICIFSHFLSSANSGLKLIKTFLTSQSLHICFSQSNVPFSSFFSLGVHTITSLQFTFPYLFWFSLVAPKNTRHLSYINRIIGWVLFSFFGFALFCFTVAKSNFHPTEERKTSEKKEKLK